MRIAIIGAGGQVAAEVTLMLTSVAKVEILPLVRTRSSSAFLRYHGVPVAHADITDRALAPHCLAGANVVANFALAGGTPSQARRQNEEIIRTTFEHSDRSATIVFFSTLSVHGGFDAEGRRRRTTYGDLKLGNERLVSTLARQRGQPAYILRLGHVAGSYQGLTQVCRDEILSPPVVAPDPERLSNVTHTVTITDALLAIGRGRAGPPGLYDLVNVPQWTWRQVYEKEAADLGVTLVMIDGIRDSRPAFGRRLKRGLFTAIGGVRTKDVLLRMLGRLPDSFGERLRAEYYVNRARSEIAVLNRPPKPLNPGTLWPGLETRSLAGLARTEDLFASNAFPIDQRPAARWPSDLVLPLAKTTAPDLS